MKIWIHNYKKFVVDNFLSIIVREIKIESFLKASISAFKV